MNADLPEDGSGPLVLRNALVLTMDPALGDFGSGDVLIENGRIAAVGADVATDAPALDCSGRIVMPGFVNSHHHNFQTALRGYWSDALAADYFSQSRQGENAVFHVYEPDDVRLAQYAGALEQLAAGTTTVVDTSQCTETPEHTDAAIRGLVESGARAVYAYSPRAHGSTPHSTYAYPYDLDRLETTYFPSRDQLVTLALGSPVDETAWRLAREHDLDVFTHVNDEAAGLKVEDLDKAGLVGPWNTFIHCTGLADSTWRTIARTGASVSLSNLVEQTLCTGSPGLQAALDHGIRPSFSTDAVSLGPTDPFSQMRAAYALQRSRLQERAIRGEDVDAAYLDTRDILEMATIEGARATHLEDRVGSLTPGKEADVVILNAGLLNAAPMNHAAGTVVMQMDTSNVESVLVGGRFVKRDHRLVGVDVEEITNALQRSVEGLVARSGSRRVLLSTCRET